MKNLAKFIKSLFVKKQPDFSYYMNQARKMMKEARDCKNKDFPCATKAAVEAAKSWRKAAHAHNYYKNTYGI